MSTDTTHDDEHRESSKVEQTGLVSTQSEANQAKRRHAERATQDRQSEATEANLGDAGATRRRSAEHKHVK